MKKQNGFTLVELAIVLMIIGLLIGGVLRGQEILQNAKITSTIEQVKAYQAAFHTFVDTYSNYPGDMALATTKIPGCNTANACQNGNGNAIIGSQNAGQGMHANEPWQEIDPAIASENTQFWKQISLAHLIAGVNPSATTPEWGKSHPSAKMGNAGFFIRYTNLAGGDYAFTGHIFVLRKNISGDASGCPGNGFCAATPMRAAQLDRKMDDGIAVTGSVWAISAAWERGCGVPGRGTQGTDGYDPRITEETCDMMFLIQ